MIRLVLVTVLFGTGCIRYEPYNKRSKDKAQAEQTCAPALEAYTKNIEPLVEKRCIRCHVAGGSGAVFAAFQAGDAKWNMGTFAQLMQGNADAIFKKASSAQNHAGGKQLEDGDQEKIKSFFAAVANCATPVARSSSLCEGKTLPRRVNLLSSMEIKNSVKDIAGVTIDINIPAATSFEDANKNPRLAFTNDQKSRTIDGNIAFNLKQAAATIAAGFNTTKKDALGCSVEPLSDSCIQKLGSQVYRRPLSADEVTDLKGLGSFTNLVTFLFQSPDFLYRTEMGDAASGDKMTSYEIASALSYLIRGTSPDEQLMTLASQGTLLDSATRRSQALRLMSQTSDLDRPLMQFFIQWLEIGRSASADKVGAYDGKAVFAESQSFINKIISEKGSLQTLLTQEENGRFGILQQRAFLASHSNNQSTAPVKVGKAIARNLLCLPLPPPPANVSTDLKESGDLKTTRSKLEAHTANPMCASCHARIDPFGIPFENFDPLGLPRTTENGEAIDTSVELKLNLSFDKRFENSNDLIESLSTSKELTRCFDSFYQQFAYGTLSCEARPLDPDTSIQDYILDLVSSERFITRL
jgi:hypothetical protein